jgi:hypothetical protein
MHRAALSDVALWRFDRLSEETGITHWVSGRSGGVSQTPYDSLNLGLRTDDAPSNVKENRERLFNALGVHGEAVASCRQIHGNSVIRVDGRQTDAPEGDAILTSTAGIMLMLLMADCVPVLVYDPVQRVAGLAHAGWRGTAGLIAQRLVNRMTDDFCCQAGDLMAGVGPSIGPCCFEVGEDVIERVRSTHSNVEALLSERTNDGRAKLNLWTANHGQLTSTGVRSEQIEVAEICTKCNRSDFFSDRAQRPSGRFAAGTMLL